jgi:NTP pyrophosphatase (non-canonical NTP hydrolase)
MTFDDFKKDCLRTSHSNLSQTYIYYGLVGEYGEVIETLKKIFYHNNRSQEKVDHLKEELGDFCWYIAMLIITNNITYGTKRFEELKQIIAQYPGIKEDDYSAILKKTLNFVNLLCDPGNIENKLLAISYTTGLFYFVLTICKHFDFTIEEVFNFNVQKRLKRYPERPNFEK